MDALVNARRGPLLRTGPLALVDLIKSIATPERVQSLQVRLDNENLLTAKAMQRPIFGWGRWARSHVYDASGKDISITDGLWVIALGESGLVGLIAISATLLLPTLLLWKRMPSYYWFQPQTAGLAALAMLAVLHMTDNLFNAMVNPLYILAVAGVNNMLVELKQLQRTQIHAEASSFEEPAYSHQFT
jgi:hypothetical protein